MKKKIFFYKYQGTGNDFIMIDNRDQTFQKDRNLIEKLCDRRFGIGADGLILLQNHGVADFSMVYYNSDGNESTMCGNGGRCLAAFANFLKVFKDKCTFMAIDGLHEAEIADGMVKLKMTDVEIVNKDGDDFVLNTGSPHYVKFVEDIENYKVFEAGNKIRNSDTYKEDGINVNFVENTDTGIFVRTYERGVEDETFSCGTGVTAAALSVMINNDTKAVKVKTLGGYLEVSAERIGISFINIWLHGPAEQVFYGEIEI